MYFFFFPAPFERVTWKTVFCSTLNRDSPRVKKHKLEQENMELEKKKKKNEKLNKMVWGRWMRKEMSVIYLWKFVREDWFRLAAGRRKWKNNKILSTYYTKEKRIVESISSEQIIRVFGNRGVWRAGVNNRMKGKQTISICLYTAFPDFNPFLKKVVREWLWGKKKEKKRRKNDKTGERRIKAVKDVFVGVAGEGASIKLKIGRRRWKS